MDNERLAAFLHSFDYSLPPLLNLLEQEAKVDNVPIIRPQTQALLRFLITWIQPKSILEVGTAVGFSALFMSTYAPEDCHITTIERYDKYIVKAKKNFELAGKTQAVTLLEGDAAEVLHHLTEDEHYDFIFMDAAKGQYIHFLPDTLRLLKPKGLLVSDNIFQEGEILESKYAIPRRNRTIYKRMRQYLDALTSSDKLETVILPVGDGVTLSVKKGEGNVIESQSANGEGDKDDKEERNKKA